MLSQHINPEKSRQLSIFIQENNGFFVNLLNHLTLEQLQMLIAIDPALAEVSEINYEKRKIFGTEKLPPVTLFAVGKYLKKSEFLQLSHLNKAFHNDISPTYKEESEWHKTVGRWEPSFAFPEEFIKCFSLAFNLPYLDYDEVKNLFISSLLCLPFDLGQETDFKFLYEKLIHKRDFDFIQLATFCYYEVHIRLEISANEREFLINFYNKHFPALNMFKEGDQSINFRQSDFMRAVVPTLKKLNNKKYDNPPSLIKSLLTPTKGSVQDFKRVYHEITLKTPSRVQALGQWLEYVFADNEQVKENWQAFLGKLILSHAIDINNAIKFTFFDEKAFQQHPNKVNFKISLIKNPPLEIFKLGLSVNDEKILIKLYKLQYPNVDIIKKNSNDSICLNLKEFMWIVIPEIKNILSLEPQSLKKSFK